MLIFLLRLDLRALIWPKFRHMRHTSFNIRDTRQPGDDDLIVDLHRRGYAPHGERFSQAFLDFVAETLVEADLNDPTRGMVWFAEDAGVPLGCAAMVNRGDRGQLRWVVVSPEARGMGLGRTLVDLAMNHAAASGHASVFLETTDGLTASKTLYERLGFITVEEAEAPLWHGNGVLIIMERPC